MDEEFQTKVLEWLQDFDNHPKVLEKTKLYLETFDILENIFNQETFIKEVGIKISRILSFETAVQDAVMEKFSVVSRDQLLFLKWNLLKQCLGAAVIQKALNEKRA